MNGFLEQLNKIWSELSAPQRLTIGVAALAVFVGMVGLVYWSSQPQMRLLYGGIDNKEMGAVVEALDEEKIPYEMGSGGRSIFVPADKVYQVRMKLAGEGIPSGGGVGYEIFDKGNFGISDFVQRTNFVRAIQGELARSISELEGVRSSRVMIVLPENKLLMASENIRPTASVFVDVGGRVLSEENVNAIRYLVANAVEGLKIGDVAVVDNKGNVLTTSMGEDNSFGAAADHFKFRKGVENYFTQKIHSMLIPIAGEGNVVVRVSADLNYDSQTVVEETYDPEGQVVRTQVSSENSSSKSENTSGGTAGVASNVPMGGGSASAGGQASSSNSTKNRTVAYEINKSVSETVRKPGSVRSISAAVFLAKRIDQGATVASPVSRSPEEIETIRKMVINALGLDPEESNARVTVEEVAFERPADMIAGAENGKSTTIAGLSLVEWMDIGRKFLAVGIAIAIFMVFLGMLKKQKSETVKFEVIEERPESRNEAPMNLTPEVLNELIQQKPDNVSAALKGWMNGGDK